MTPTPNITSLSPLPEDLHPIILDFLQELVPTKILLLSKKHYDRLIPRLYKDLVVNHRTVAVFIGLEPLTTTMQRPADDDSDPLIDSECGTRKTLALAHTTSLTIVDYEAAQAFASSLILPVNDNEREMRSIKPSQTIKLFPSLTHITFDSALLAAVHSINRFDAFRIDFLAALALAFTHLTTVTFNLLDIPRAGCTYHLPLLLLLNAIRPSNVVFNCTLFDAPFLLGNYALRQTSHIRMNLHNAAPRLCIDQNGKPRTKHKKTFKVISAMMAGFAMDTLTHDEFNNGCSNENRLEIRVKTKNVRRLRRKAIVYLPTYQIGCVEAFKKVEQRFTVGCL